MQAAYRSRFDGQTGLWQILSRSGNVLYASSDGDYVQTVCRELCASFTTCGGRRDGTSPPAARRYMADG